MKKIIALVVSIALLLSVFTASFCFSASATAPTGDNLISFDGKTASDFGGTEWNHGTIFITERDGIPSIGITPNPASGGGYAYPVLNLDVTGKDMSQKQYIEFHFQGPGMIYNTAQTHLYMQLFLYTGANWDIFEMSLEHSVIWTKADGESEWTAVNAGGVNEFWLPKTFSGLIRIEMSRFDKAADGSSNHVFDATQLKGIKLWVNTQGENGNILLDSFKTEKTVIAPKGDNIVNFNISAIWELGWLEWAGESVYSKSTRDGIDTQKLFVPAGQASAGVYTVLDTLGQNMNDKEYITFHITAPKQGMDNCDDGFTMNVQLITLGDYDVQQYWTMSDNTESLGYYYYKNDADSEWTVGQADVSGNIWFNENFSGYVRLVLDNYVKKDGVYVGNAALDRNEIARMVNWIGNLDTTIDNTIYLDSYTTEITSYPIVNTNKLLSFDGKDISDLAYAKWDVGTLEIGERDGNPTVQVIGSGDYGNSNPVFILDTKGRDLSNATSLQFYLEGAKTDNPDSTMSIEAVLITRKASGETEYWRMDNNTAYYMYKDDATNECLSYPWGSTMWISKNFAGYVQVPLEKFTLRQIGEDGGYVTTDNSLLNLNELTEVMFFIYGAGGVDCINDYITIDSIGVDVVNPIEIYGVDGFVYDAEITQYDNLTINYGPSTIRIETNFASKDYRKVVMTDSDGNEFNGTIELDRYEGLNKSINITTTSVHNETKTYTINLNRDAIIAGDANSDGITSSEDLVCLRKAILGCSTLNEKEFIAADLNDNGELCIIDLVKLKKLLINK